MARPKGMKNGTKTFESCTKIMAKALEGKTYKQVAYETGLHLTYGCITRKKFPLFAWAVKKYNK